MNAVITGLLDDLAAEHADLAALLRDQPEEAWAKPTPAAGWTVRDQIAHLAHFDDITALCIGRPQEFVSLRDSLTDLQAYVDGVGVHHTNRPASDMLAWWEDKHRTLRAAAVAADPAARVPWFGPSMSLASKLTARLMETWAHGQDVADTLGVRRTPTARLRHVARIGVRAFAYSYRAHGLAVPDTAVHVELVPPGGGEHWSWGDPALPNVVTGTAEDFCLVVTQRRHLADTALQVRGETARHWMTIAQAFAGPPGAGRKPGQFATRPAAPSSTAG